MGRNKYGTFSIMIVAVIVTGFTYNRVLRRKLFSDENAKPLKYVGSAYSEVKVRKLTSQQFDNDKSNMNLVNLNTNVSCPLWAVVTTIFEPSDSVRKVAQNRSWCLVIVGDMKTPSRENYLTNLGPFNKESTVFLSTDDQSRIFPRLSETIPWNHFARKNIGYMYAIKLGAEVIWDFDDDNINLVPANLAETTRIYRTVCGTFSNHLFNPYPYFAVNETYTWPRGFPLEHIRDKTTFPQLCTSSEVQPIGVIQSLANIQPDVDAIYRFTRDTPFNFGATPTSHLPVMVPKNAYTPFNGQATLWMKNAFRYMALPASVTGRVSDIWRSYVAEYFFYKMGLQVLFVPPYVDQYRNVHDYLTDFKDELDLYQKSNALLKWFSSAELNAKNLVELYKEMYERDYLYDGDVDFITAWEMTFDHRLYL